MTQKIVEKAYENCHQWTVAHAIGGSFSCSEMVKVKQWSPPRWDEVECNIGCAW